MKKYIISFLLSLLMSIAWADETNKLSAFETDLRNGVLVDNRSGDIESSIAKCQERYNLTNSQVRTVLLRIIEDGLKNGSKQPNMLTIRAIMAISCYGDNETGFFLLNIADSKELTPIRRIALCSYLKMQSDDVFAGKVREVIAENPKLDKSLRFSIINWLSTFYYNQADERRKKDIVQVFHQVILEEKDITNFRGLDEFLKEKDAEYAKSDARIKHLKGHLRKVEKKNVSDIYIEEELKWFGKERPKKEPSNLKVTIQT